MMEDQQPVVREPSLAEAATAASSVDATAE
jgi:hypothetical protein